MAESIQWPGNYGGTTPEVRAEIAQQLAAELAA